MESFPDPLASQRGSHTRSDAPPSFCKPCFWGFGGFYSTICQVSWTTVTGWGPLLRSRIKFQLLAREGCTSTTTFCGDATCTCTFVSVSQGNSLIPFKLAALRVRSTVAPGAKEPPRQSSCPESSPRHGVLLTVSIAGGALAGGGFGTSTATSTRSGALAVSD